MEEVNETRCESVFRDKSKMINVEEVSVQDRLRKITEDCMAEIPSGVSIEEIDDKFPFSSEKSALLHEFVAQNFSLTMVEVVQTFLQDSNLQEKMKELEDLKKQFPQTTEDGGPINQKLHNINNIKRKYLRWKRDMMLAKLKDVKDEEEELMISINKQNDILVKHLSKISAEINEQWSN